MTKQELYKALTDAGVKLPEYRRITQTALEETYATRFGNVPQKQREEEPPPALFFEHAGWCEELGCSYFMGTYQPRDWGEYNALKPFAKGGEK